MPEKNNIFFLAHTSAMGGAEHVEYALLCAAPVPVTVWCFADGPFTEKIRKHATVEILAAAPALSDFKRRSSWWRACTLMGVVLKFSRYLARRLKPDHTLVVFSSKGLVMGALARRQQTFKLIWHCHDVFSARHFGNFNRRLVAALAKRYAEKIICCSQAAQRALLDLGLSPQKITVVPNGVDAKIFDQLRPEIPQLRHQLRSDLGLSAEAVIVGHFARLSPWKGQALLLQAVAKIREPRPQVLLVGGALFGEDNIEAQLKALVQSLGLADSVIFLGNRSDVPRLMMGVDVIVNSSIAEEAFSLAVLEAMASGTPLVATRLGGNTEAADDEREALFFTVGDAEELAQRIERYLSHPELREKISRAARERVKAHFDLPPMQQNFWREILGWSR